MDPAAAESRSKDRWFLIAGLAIVVLGIGGLILLGPQELSPASKPVRTFSFPSTSMEPTLRLGEQAFGLMRAYESRPPARGDVVVYLLPRDASTIYVGRIVGLPGESVQMWKGILQIDGRAVPKVDEGTYQLASQDESKSPSRARLKRETLPNGVSHLTLDLIDNAFYDNTPVYQVPQDHYFLMGDNRDNSTDSRALNQVGYIPRANVIGQIGWIFWSSDFSRIGTVPR